jgi:hypothetical protein
MAMKVYQFLVTFVAVSTALPVYVFFIEFGRISLLHVALSFFLALNSLISLWEIGLGIYISNIKLDYERLCKKYGKHHLGAVVDLMNHSITVGEIFSLRFWTRIWSTYSLYDPSYSNRESFGFFVDVGNGWTTIVPTILFLIAMTRQNVLPARLLGMIGLVKFYQEFYGTCVYFLSFIFNGRYKGKPITEVLLFVGVSNGLWFFFPLIGMAVCVQLIESNSFEVLR